MKGSGSFADGQRQHSPCAVAVPWGQVLTGSQPATSGSDVIVACFGLCRVRAGSVIAVSALGGQSVGGKLKLLQKILMPGIVCRRRTVVARRRAGNQPAKLEV